MVYVVPQNYYSAQVHRSEERCHSAQHFSFFICFWTTMMEICQAFSMQTIAVSIWLTNTLPLACSWDLLTIKKIQNWPFHWRHTTNPFLHSYIKSSHIVIVNEWSHVHFAHNVSIVSVPPLNVKCKNLIQCGAQIIETSKVIFGVSGFRGRVSPCFAVVQRPVV